MNTTIPEVVQVLKVDKRWKREALQTLINYLEHICPGTVFPGEEGLHRTPECWELKVKFIDSTTAAAFSAAIARQEIGMWGKKK